MGAAGVNRAVFLDRDGTLNRIVRDETTGEQSAPRQAGQVQLEEGVCDALLALQEAGFMLVVASNQPDAAKGKTTLGELRQVHERFVALLAEGGVHLDGWKYCYHHPDGEDRYLGRPCICRKPLPGLLFAAAVDHGIDLTLSWMVGDSDVDVQAGAMALCRTALIDNPDSLHRRNGVGAPHIVARSVEEAAPLILESLEWT